MSGVRIQKPTSEPSVHREDKSHRSNMHLPTNDKMSYLSSTSVFGALSQNSLDTLLAEIEWLQVQAGETLFRQGEIGDSLYVVISGRLRVSVEHTDGSEETIAEVGRGESVGELAILTGEPRAATVRAIRDTELAKLSRAGVERTILKDTGIMMHLARFIAARQQRGVHFSEATRIRTIAIVPCGNEVPSREFVDDFLPALQHLGKTLHLNSEQFTNQLQNIGVGVSRESNGDDSKAMAWLHDMEASYQFVVYEADSFPSSWTSRCVRQADRILVVATAESEPKKLLDHFAHRQLQLSGDMARTELVLLHKTPQGPFFGTEKWLTNPRIAAHYHVGFRSNTDLTRLVRLVTGNCNALVLSGGGARAFAHIGVIRAMKEAGVPIDYVGGTSMGAVIAAQLAVGWDCQTMSELNAEYWTRFTPDKDYTLPLVALTSGRMMNKMLQDMFGKTQIEDLGLSFFCVSTSLSRAEVATHKEGLLWKALRASVSVPGVGPPVFWNGEILVDGGLLNNLPVDVMKKLCQGRVLAVDVSQKTDLPTNIKNRESLSGWTLLLRRLNPFAKRLIVPSILTILHRTTTLNSLRYGELTKRQADVCFDPPVNEFGIFEWEKIDQIVEAGYLFAAEKMKHGSLHSNFFD